jgi:predicted nucleotide-binding protein
VVADISVLNANVFYELGLTHALGKDTILLKRRDTPLPADFGGAHYYEYDLNDFADGKNQLQQAVKNWVQNNKAYGVRELRGS